MQTYVKVYSDIGNCESGPMVVHDYEPTYAGEMLEMLDVAAAEVELMEAMHVVITSGEAKTAISAVRLVQFESSDRFNLSDDAYELLWDDSYGLDDLLELAVEAFTYESIE